MENKEFKDGIKGIIEKLDWFLIEKCSNCEKKVKILVLDNKCPVCKNEIIDGDVYPEGCEKYQEIFIDAMRMSIEEEESGRGDFGSSYIQAYTSFEIFLRKVAEEKMNSRNTNPKEITAILDSNKVNVAYYIKLLKNLDVDIDKPEMNLKEIQLKRNQIVHKAYNPSNKEMLEAFKKIADIFYILHPYSIFDKKRRIQIEEI